MEVGFVKIHSDNLPMIAFRKKLGVVSLYHSYCHYIIYLVISCISPPISTYFVLENENYWHMIDIEKRENIL